MQRGGKPVDGLGRNFRYCGRAEDWKYSNLRRSLRYARRALTTRKDTLSAQLAAELTYRLPPDPPGAQGERVPIYQKPSLVFTHTQLDTRAGAQSYTYLAALLLERAMV